MLEVFTGVNLLKCDTKLFCRWMSVFERSSWYHVGDIGKYLPNYTVSRPTSLEFCPWLGKMC